MRKFLLMLALLLPCVAARSQSYTTITSTATTDGSSAPLKAGTFCAIPTDGADNPIPFGTGSSQALPIPVCRNIVNGALAAPLQLATPSGASPQIQYRFTIKDTTTGRITTYPHVSISGATWSFDSYNTGLSVPSVPVSTVVAGAKGDKGDTGTAAVVTSNGTNGGFDVPGALRAGSISSIPGASGPWGPVPLGPDLAVMSQGPADVVPWNLPLIATSTTSVGIGVSSIVVPGASNYYSNNPTASHAPTGLIIDRFQLGMEALLAGTDAQCAGFSPPVGKWCNQDATHLVANFTRAHTAPYTVDQAGAILNRAYYVMQTAQNGDALHWCQQDGNTKPYNFSCWLGDGSYGYMNYSGGVLSMRATNYLADHALPMGLLFTATQPILQTSPNDFILLRDVLSTQYAKFWPDRTELPAKISLGGTTSSNCMLNNVNGAIPAPVLQITKADGSGLCTLVSGDVWGSTINAVAGFQTNGMAGFTGTKTVGTCVMIISGGIITSISGC